MQIVKNRAVFAKRVGRALALNDLQFLARFKRQVVFGDCWKWHCQFQSKSWKDKNQSENK